MSTVVIIGLCLVGVVGAMFLWQVWSDHERRIAALEARQPKEHSYATRDGLDDATAVLMDVLLDIEAWEARLKQAKAILGTVRKGPQAYDGDQPAGKRPKEWTRRRPQI